MSLENQVIIDELKEQGIAETLATGLTFETSEDLTAWVEVYKNAMPDPVKGLNDFTKEELEELSKDPEFKGAKGLQGFLDAERAKMKSKPILPKTPTPKAEIELPEDVKKQLEEMQSMRAEIQKDKFEKNVTTKAKAAGLDDKSIAKVLKIVKVGDDDTKVDAEISEMKQFLDDLGVKRMGTPGGGGKTSTDTIKKLGEAYNAKMKAKKEKFK